MKKKLQGHELHHINPQQIQILIRKRKTVGKDTYSRLTVLENKNHVIRSVRIFYHLILI